MSLRQRHGLESTGFVLPESSNDQVNCPCSFYQKNPCIIQARLAFWVRRPPGGGLPREGVVAKNFMPSLESSSSLGFEERNLGCPANLAGMSRTSGRVQKVYAKKVRAHFSFPDHRGVVFTGVVFAKGASFDWGVLGGGVWGRVQVGGSEKRRAREPRNLTHELSHESALENAHGSVHEDIHGNTRESWGFLRKNAPRCPHEDSHDSAHGDIWQCTRTRVRKCARSIFTCPILTCFVSCQVVVGGLPVENEGKGEGGGEGGDRQKEAASQCARVCQNYPLANQPWVSPRSRRPRETLCQTFGISGLEAQETRQPKDLVEEF